MFYSAVSSPGQPHRVAAPFAVEILLKVDEDRLQTAFACSASIGVALGIYDCWGLDGSRYLQLVVPIPRTACQLELAAVATFLFRYLDIANVPYQEVTVRGYLTEFVEVNVDGPVLDPENLLVQPTSTVLIAGPSSQARAGSTEAFLLVIRDAFCVGEGH